MAPRSVLIRWHAACIRSNLARWKSEYGQEARLVRLGYVPGLMQARRRIPEAEKDIDVLFFGAPLALAHTCTPRGSMCP